MTHLKNENTYLKSATSTIKPHSYAGYEDEFREFMVEAGIPVEKELPPKKDEEE